MRLVVVLGGSYSGIRAAQELARAVPVDTHRVVLVEQFSHLVHRFVLPRFSVVRGLERQAFIPYTDIFSRNALGRADDDGRDARFARVAQVVRATAVRLTSRCVELDRPVAGWGTSIPYDYLLYALGGRMPDFLDLSRHPSKTGGRLTLNALQDTIGKARRVAIVGGGALGVQYAGDIKAHYPDKTVTLIHSHARLLHAFSHRLSDAVLERLQALDVNLIMGERVVAPTHGQDGTHTITLDSGRKTECDLQLNCTGIVYNTGLMAELSPSSIHGKTNSILTSSTLQLHSTTLPESVRERIYVIGDVANIQLQPGCAGQTIQKNAVSGYFQADVASRNIIRQIKAEGSLEHYVPGPVIIKVTVGLDTFIYQRPTERHAASGAIELDEGYVDDEGSDEPEIEVETLPAPLDLDASRMWELYGASLADMNA